MTEISSKFEKRILDFIGISDYRPLKQHELARAMRLTGEHRQLFRQALYGLEKQGRLVRLRKNRWGLPTGTKTIIGTLQVHPSGFGFVVPDEPDADDVFISKYNQGAALHGDHVQVDLFHSGRATSESRPSASRDGRVQKVLERKVQQITGTFRQARNYDYVLPDNSRYSQDIRITGTQLNAKPIAKPRDMDKVIVKLEPWVNSREPLTGTIIEILGPSDGVGVDMISVLRSYGLEETFPGTVEEECENLSPTLTASDLENRMDLRNELIFTIDPDDARDFDDAISYKKHADGTVELGVHIADVAHYVKPETAIDREAYLRGTSAYLVDRVITMLPGQLTTDVCSLNPDEDRLTHSVFITLDAQLEVVDIKTSPSVIHSKARLTYDQVQLMLDKQPDHGIAEDVVKILTAIYQLTRLIREKRMHDGSLNFNMPEIKCRLDEDTGKVIEIVQRTSNEAYALIEECMLMANCAVAEKLQTAFGDAIYRVHPPPSDDQLAQIATDLQSLGILAAPQNPTDMNALIARVASEPVGYAVTLTLLRNLNRARYQVKVGEHYGLGFSAYSHFTSPIRRYPDLIAHRLLCALERNEARPSTADELHSMARHCSEMEQNAEEAEQESIRIKRISFYDDRLWRGDTGPFEAKVTAITGKGLIVELADSLQRGMVKFLDLEDDYYEINEEKTRAHGRRGNTTWQIGDPIKVELVKVDKRLQRIDFRLAGKKAKTKSHGRNKDRPSRNKKQNKSRRRRPQT